MSKRDCLFAYGVHLKVVLLKRFAKIVCEL